MSSGWQRRSASHGAFSSPNDEQEPEAEEPVTEQNRPPSPPQSRSSSHAAPSSPRARQVLGHWPRQTHSSRHSCTGPP